jgi:molybdate transport system substrate-binding protein
MAKKAVHRPALDGGVDLVAKGEADLGIYPTSEIVNIKGLVVAGPLPPELQLVIVYGAGITADGGEAEPAKAFIEFLTDPAKRGLWKNAGFEPPA